MTTQPGSAMPSLEEGTAMLGEASLRRLGISGDAFLRRWDAGGYMADWNRGDPDVRAVAALIPFARQAAA